MLVILFIYVAAFAFPPVDLLSKTLSRKKRSDEFIPCDEGWFLFREKCLKLRGASKIKGEEVVWERAEARCKDDGGNLVTIESKEELDFIVSFMLLDASNILWIGLNDRENSTHFSWSDGSAVNFTYWAEGQPSNNANEDCVALMFNPATDNVGKWDDIRCSHWYGYICQKRINRRKKSQNPQFCTAEQGGGWKFQNTCNHIVMEMKTWDSAEEHCKENYGGHLVTVLDKGVDLYLDHILLTINKQFWIGMKITDGLKQKWTSGWFVTYNRTLMHYSEVPDGTCVLRKNSTVWNVVPCSKKNPFLCDTFRGPPVLKPPENGSHCPVLPSDWQDLGGEYCYFFETEKTTSWFEALYECKRRGGNLVSIHSKEESETIVPFVKYIATGGLWIGMLRQLVREDVFMWSDGTPVDYQHWGFWEPSGFSEKCVEVWTIILDWNDVWCTEKKGYICSVKKVTPNVTEIIETIDCTCSMPYNVLIGVSLCAILVLILLGVVVYCSVARNVERRKASIASVMTQSALETYRLQYRCQTDVKVTDGSPQFQESHYEDPNYNGTDTYESVD